MKKILFILPFFLFAENIPMPPMPPALPLNQNNDVKVQKNNNKNKNEKRNTKVKMPKECSIIPPTLIFMPPPLEADLRKCKNKLFMPTINLAKKELSKKYKNIKIEKISVVDGFDELYAIKTNKGVFYCNKDVRKCFRVCR
jgi:hypothetical protein